MSKYTAEQMELYRSVFDVVETDEFDGIRVSELVPALQAHCTGGDKEAAVTIVNVGVVSN